MTVQELIDALNKVEDKSLPVCYYTFRGEYEDIYGVEEHKNIYENFFFLRLLFEKILSMNQQNMSYDATRKDTEESRGI